MQEMDSVLSPAEIREEAGGTALSSMCLFPHQEQAIAWMQKIENRENYPLQNRGGILAHAMGLGKTRTMLSLIQTTLPGITLVVCPKPVIKHWVAEAAAIKKLVGGGAEVAVYHGISRTFPELTSGAISGANIIVTTFDIARMEYSIQKKISPNQSKKTVGVNRTKSRLFTTVWDRVIVDEAHRICEQGSKTTRALGALISKRRWCVTGTPYKNDLGDLVSLCKFLQIPPYSQKTWWVRNAHNKWALNLWRSRFLHVRCKSTAPLPEMFISDVVCEMSPFDYQLQKLIRRGDCPNKDGKESKQELELLKILRMRQAAIHPLLMATPKALRFLCSGLPPQTSPATTPDTVLSPVPLLRGGTSKLLKGSGSKRKLESDSLDYCCSACGSTDLPRKKAKQPSQEGSELLESPFPQEDIPSYTRTVCLKNHKLCEQCIVYPAMCPVCIRDNVVVVEGWHHSPKTLRLLSLLRENVLESKESVKSVKSEESVESVESVELVESVDKCIIFSQWTSCLDLLELMLSHYNVPFFRFDGSISSIDDRCGMVEKFSSSKHVKIMLTSLGAGGEGIDLTCANVVILMEPYWNISMEQQAIDRAHRIGQSKEVKVFKLNLAGSIEEWVLQLQRCKLSEQRFYLDGICPEEGQDRLGVSMLPEHTRQNGALTKLMKRQERMTVKPSCGNSWKGIDRCSIPSNYSKLEQVS